MRPNTPGQLWSLGVEDRERQPWEGDVIAAAEGLRTEIDQPLFPGRLIIITTYEPDPARWEADFKRRKR